MAYGPFKSRDEMAKLIAANAALHDPMFWTVRPVATGVASGWLSLMEIEPAHAAIELGSIWFSPRLQRTRAATEAMFLLLRRAADELGYRRLVWKCDALNAASIKAAQRLGFTAEGVLRAHKVVKGRRRDTAMFSITAEEWPDRRDAMASWLAAENFGPDGTAKRSLANFRPPQ
jgi:RimJ/RimL family protein N-acetyltransferase